MTKDFCDDEEKMRDFFYLSKKEFLESYSYGIQGHEMRDAITEQEWLATYVKITKNNRKVEI